MAAHQAPPSLGFSRQEHWSGMPFPSPMQKSESEVAQSCPTLSDPMDCSLPGSSIHGIFPGKSTGVGCHCLLQLIHSRLFLISVIVLFVSVCLFFNSSLLIDSCILSILFSRFWIIFTINIWNSFSGRFPTSSSFVWFGGHFSCSFTC